ncbi:cupin-like domain-containing protein [Sphingosinicella sp.]|uniref:cupin-like domain-containing protein n=1 Tax=Sphingosinicella sp. TaxID=1917971 RepID=UPI00403813CB
MTSFERPQLDAFAAAYPEQPVKLRHGLCGHELLTLESLAALAGRMRPEDIEYYPGDTPFGVDPKSAPGNGLSIQETIRRIEQCGSWMVLKFVEQDETYRALLDEALAPLEPAVRPTGAMHTHRGFVFISSPGSATPLHFDPEHNILLQIRGEKVMSIFPADDEELAPMEEHERYYAGGHRNLPWRDEFQTRGSKFHLSPGDALHVPFMAPHWVKNGDAVSVSFSITWRSDWSFREECAHGMNRLLRHAGMHPARPKRYPHQNHIKSFSYRAIAKVRRLAGRDAP